MDDLQFQKAEFSDQRPKCAACKSVIESSYFHLAGRVICHGCAEKVRAGQQRPENSLVIRGILYGLGAAVACSIVYAIITMTTGMELALISIAVGYIVGRAVRKGSGGLGGRRCQVAAVALTYFSITSSYAPIIVKEAAKSAQAKAKEAADKGESVRVKPARTTAGIVVGLGAILALSLAAPLLEIMGGASGIIGLIIIFVGLAQAWRQTARDPRLLMGPYTLSEGPALNDGRSLA